MTRARRADAISRDEIEELITGLGSLTDALADADPDDKAALYKELGVELTYQPTEQKVRAEITLDSHIRWDRGRVRGGFERRIAAHLRETGAHAMER